MVVFLLTEALDEVLDEYALLAAGKLIEVIPQIEDFPLGDSSSLLHRVIVTMMMMLLKRIFLFFELKR